MNLRMVRVSIPPKSDPCLPSTWFPYPAGKTAQLKLKEQLQSAVTSHGPALMLVVPLQGGYFGGAAQSKNKTKSTICRGYYGMN